MPFSTHFEVTIPADGSWVYQDLVINETAKEYSVPRHIVITNISDKILNYKLMTKEEGTGELTWEGMYLEANGKVQESNISNYKIGIRFDAAQASTETCIVSASGYTKQTV